MTKRKQTDTEKRVLVFLYEKKDAGREITFDEIVAGTGLSPRQARIAIRSLTDDGLIGGNGPDLLRSATETLAKMQPDLSPAARGYAENVVLVASVLAKADEAFLAEELSYDSEFVALVGSRLRTSGIWKGESVNERHLNAWKEDPTAYLMDCAVAVGDLMVVGENDEKQLLYRMTSGGQVHVKNLMAR
jgi:DNA-binding Lrp family transcriptional regulator